MEGGGVVVVGFWWVSFGDEGGKRVVQWSGVAMGDSSCFAHACILTYALESTHMGGRLLSCFLHIYPHRRALAV